MSQGADTASPVSIDPAVADGHHLARGAAANALVLLAANFRAIFTILISRILGPAALGQFGVAFTTTELLSKAGVLGFDSSVVPMVATRAAAGERDACRRLLRRAVMSAGVASTLLAVAGLAIVQRVTDGHVLGAATSLQTFFGAFSHGGALMLLALPAIAIARVCTGASRGVLAMRSELYSRGLTETWVTTGVFVVAVALGLRDRAPALAVVAGASAAAVVAFILASHALATAPMGPIGAMSNVARQTGTPSLRAMLQYSLPTAGSNLLNVLVTQADVLLLAAYVGRAPGVTPESFGVFCAAAQIAVGLRKVRQIFDPIFAPIVATRAVSEHRARLRETVAGPGRWVLAAQLPLVGTLMLSSGAILSIYGRDFRQGALWLALLAVAHGTNTFAGLVETLLMLERPGLNLINAAVTVAVQIVAGLVLIPLFGVTGAAVAMLLGFGVQGVLRFVEIRRVYGWSWPWQSLNRPVIAFTIALLPAAAVRVAGGRVLEVASGVLFLLLYVGAWRVLGAEPEDREIWRTIVSSKSRRAFTARG